MLQHTPSISTSSSTYWQSHLRKKNKIHMRQWFKVITKHDWLVPPLTPGPSLVSLAIPSNLTSATCRPVGPCRFHWIFFGLNTTPFQMHLTIAPVTSPHFPLTEAYSCCPYVWATLAVTIVPSWQHSVLCLRWFQIPRCTCEMWIVEILDHLAEPSLIGRLWEHTR